MVLAGYVCNMHDLPVPCSHRSNAFEVGWSLHAYCVTVYLTRMPCHNSALQRSMEAPMRQNECTQTAALQRRTLGWRNFFQSRKNKCTSMKL